VAMAIHRAEAVRYFFRQELAEEGGHREAAADSVDSAAEEEVLAEEERAPAGRRMRTKEFLSKLEHDRIVQALRVAESKTSAQIRVYIQRGKLNGDPLIAARKKFQRLGMHKTSERNGVLIFVRPRARKFAVVGDQAIHERCGDAYWRQIVDRMREHFRNERFSDALVDAIRDIENLLATHFPKKSGSANAQSGEIVEQ